MLHQKVCIYSDLNSFELNGIKKKSEFYKKSRRQFCQNILGLYQLSQ